MDNLILGALKLCVACGEIFAWHQWSISPISVQAVHSLRLDCRRGTPELFFLDQLALEKSKPELETEISSESPMLDGLPSGLVLTAMTLPISPLKQF